MLGPDDDNQLVLCRLNMVVDMFLAACAVCNCVRTCMNKVVLWCKFQFMLLFVIFRGFLGCIYNCAYVGFTSVVYWH